MGDVNSIMLSKLHCVIVHYRAWTESTLHKFEDTWNEQKPVELVLGKGTCLYDPFFFFFFLILFKMYIISTLNFLSVAWIISL